MKFKRIDEDTVRCIVSEEDMKEYGVELDDFLKNKGKIHDFLHYIVELAAEEVDFKSKNGMLSMQVMALPKNSLAITFSEKEEYGFEDILEQIKDTVGGIENIEDPIKLEEVAEQKRKELQKKKVQPLLSIFAFDSLLDVENFSSLVTYKRPIRSDLYKNEVEGKYYLSIEKLRISKVNYNTICEMATEFATLISTEPIRLIYIKEHYKCLIEKKAIKVIQGISNSTEK